EKQVDVIVSGIFARWSKAGFLSGANAPPHRSSLNSDPDRGAADYRIFCEACHGPNGHGGSKASSIVDPAFLALITDQGLRTTVIAGRPDLGAPDLRLNVPGRAMTNQEVTDIVAWLSQQRPVSRGQSSVSNKESANGR